MTVTKMRFSRPSSAVALGILFIGVLGYAERATAQFSQRPGGPPGRSAPAPQMPQLPDSTPSPDSSSPLKAEVIVVPVRVVVLDSQGHVVTGLHKEDFQLFEDGKQQQISNFSVENTAMDVHPVVTLGARAGSGTGNPVAANMALPSNFVALFFDDVHLTFEDLARARNAAGHFLDTALQPDERVAIFTVSGQTQIDFTDDRPKLHATLLKLLPHPGSAGEATSPMGCPRMDFFEADAIQNQHDSIALGAATQDALNCAFNGETQFRRQAQDMAVRTADDLMRQADIQTEAALRRIRELIRRISVLPGQRSVLMISPGFIYPTHETELADIMDRAVHSNIEINTLDARGLYAPDMGDISHPQTGPPNGSEGALASERLLSQSTQNNVLAELADGTGGIAFHDNNDLEAGFRKAAASPESYYLLSFSPRNLKTDGKYHKLKVTLTAKQNYTIEARHGFYAPRGIETPTEAVKREIDDAIFSQDEVHGVPVTLLGGFAKADAGLDTLEVVAVINVNQVAFQTAKGVSQDNLLAVTSLFDGDGNYVTGIENNLEMKLHDENLQQLKKDGYPVDTKFSVKPGLYLVRFVLRDSNAAVFTATSSVIRIPQ